MNDFYIYLHTRQSDGRVFYVGKGRGSRYRSKAGRNRHWRNVATKHGLEAEILFDGLSEDEAFEEERNVISELRYFGEPLTNLTDGGEGASGYSHTRDAKQRISNAHKERMTHPENIRSARDRQKRVWLDPEYREKTIESMRKTWSDSEIRRRVSEAVRAVWSDPEYRDRLSASAKAKWSCQEFREKHRHSMQKVRSDPLCIERHRESVMDAWATPGRREEAGRRMRKRWSSPSNRARQSVACTSIKDSVQCSNGMVFESAAAAARWLRDEMGVGTAQVSPIHTVCRGGGKTAYGFGWEYSENGE